MPDTKRVETKRPIEQGDWNMAFLFPDEVAAARERNGLVLLPLAPVEWHGPHLAMGCDNLLAHAFARRLAREFQCPYFPPLFVGTERERKPDMLESLGFHRDAFIEGMDFPKNPVASAYFREEVFAAVVRDALHILFARMRFRRVLIVNGHGADNQRAVLDRLCREFNDGHSPGASGGSTRDSRGRSWPERLATLRGRDLDAGGDLAGLGRSFPASRHGKLAQCGLRHRGWRDLRLRAHA